MGNASFSSRKSELGLFLCFFCQAARHVSMMGPGSRAEETCHLRVRQPAPMWVVLNILCWSLIVLFWPRFLSFGIDAYTATNDYPEEALVLVLVKSNMSQMPHEKSMVLPQYQYHVWPPE